MQPTCDCFEPLQRSVHCCHCQKLIAWPRWVRTEHLHYTCLCWPCYDALDEGVTVAAVLSQAGAIVRGSAVTL